MTNPRPDGVAGLNLGFAEILRDRTSAADGDGSAARCGSIGGLMGSLNRSLEFVANVFTLYGRRNHVDSHSSALDAAT